MINFYKFIRICGADPENAVYPYVYYRQESYMNQEHEIVKRVAAARSSSEEADRLVRDYLPFIKQQNSYTGRRWKGRMTSFLLPCLLSMKQS